MSGEEKRMLTETQAHGVVFSSLEKVTGKDLSRGNASTLRAAGVTDDNLAKLVIALVSDQSVGVARFQHVLDPNAIAGFTLDRTIDELTREIVKLSAGKLCGNPSTPHQQSYPYPDTCPTCGCRVV